jgi:uncharacterized protein YrrD
MDHTRPELKYVDARELNGTAARLDGVPVIGSDGETLGKVEGFIIDVRDQRPRHVVVGAGWFIHKHFLVPIGEVRTSDGDTELRADVAKSQIENSTGFNKSEFQKLAAEDATRLDELVAAATGAGRDYSRDSFRMPQGWD